MNMGDFTKFVTLMATMSIAVERAVEVIKGFVPFLNKQLDPGTKENIRRALLQVIAVLCGAVTAYLGAAQIAGIPVADSLLKLKFDSGYIVVGLLTAGGSAFWNHILDLIGALKTQQEKTAKAMSGAPPAPVPPQPPAAAVAGAGH
jgi:hypothetical protein